MGWIYQDKFEVECCGKTEWNGTYQSGREYASKDEGTGESLNIKLKKN